MLRRRRRLGVGGGHDPDLKLLYQFAELKTLASIDALGPTLGITRTTNATYFDSAGVMQTASTGVARFDHLPISPFTSLGLFVEEARTNLCLHSEDLTNVAWTETNTDQPTTNNAAPDGETTADEIAATSTADQAFAIYQAFTGRTAGQTTTISYFIKAGTNATKAQLAYDSNGGGTDGFFCNFDLSAGTKGTVTALAAGTATSSFIEDIGGGYFRCAIVGKIAVGTVARFTISISDNISGAVFEAANLANNDSIIGWGSDIEIGTFPTSYIKTVASTVPRNADAILSNDVSWYNSSAGTLYVEWSQPIQDTGIADIAVEISDSSSSDRWFMYNNTASTDTRLDIVSSSGDNAGIAAPGTMADGVLTRMVSAAAEDDVEFYIDGNRIGTGDPSYDPFTNANRITVGSRFAGDLSYANGHIAEIRYYNVRKVNQFLEDLSNGLISA